MTDAQNNDKSAVIEAKGLVKRYSGASVNAVDGIDFTVAKGCFFGLLGPNGAGKTTLLSMLTTLMKPTLGDLRIAGCNPEKEARHIRECIGFVPQEAALYPTLTARENLNFFGSMQGLSGSELKERVESCLDIAKLSDYAHMAVEKLSGGLKRRLTIVVGLIHNPHILFLDEPTVGIDPQSRIFIYDKLKKLNRQGMTIVYTSHYMEEVERLCHEIAIIDQGSIIAGGKIEELLAGQGQKVLEVRTAEALPVDLKAKVEALGGVSEVYVEGKSITMRSSSPQRSVIEMVSLLESEGINILSMCHGATNLEQLFIALTGSRLRE
ncbi:MAG: ABC transporter ATP-binding protein [Deltaproteobacteria bacterium]|nr:ABC transporter ATP-binding protein [Deltaproteobacteria bacterium]